MSQIEARNVNDSIIFSHLSQKLKKKNLLRKQYRHKLNFFQDR